MELSRCQLKKFLIIFQQKKKFLYFGKWNCLASSLKHSYFFQKTIAYISGENLKSLENKMFSPKISKFNFLHQNFLFQKKFRGCQ